MKHQQKYKQEQAIDHAPSTPLFFLNDTEKEELFWAKLVSHGWKKGNYKYGDKEHLSLILCCAECDHVFVDLKTVTRDQAESISVEQYSSNLTKGHDCKAISEAIPEAKACYMCQGEGILQSDEECSC
jgi:hypothetical protein